MDSLKVNAAGLSLLADCCRGWAADTGASVQSIGVGPPCQATSAVVAAVHGEAGVAASVLSARLHETAEQLTSAGAQFSDGEQSSATGFAALQ